ncbi:hypothetical protein SPRG_09365 [Saprolegnia parasitica CBS 223.65]|uniref:Kinesin motor domain-containing protein n=1 Tax=Saprolegnia parasitica (strain CBS 223.65) TaxID=695850 RepID=A0A067C4H0_SAPPC|nr:hypothetical protein SPRG_09365 [Saprolegnia parasitica CBS 223.65]KDO25423.1 hypothetical protein SPRG_09365 [Saprolegnia parasitica CBS 223.65]|eukprot:XP_012203850.1 hypothetical protein SPRG_09365 [Saprolegnia parasitica CBS 223.65]
MDQSRRVSVGVRVRPLSRREQACELAKSAWSWHGPTISQQIFPAQASAKKATTTSYTFDQLYAPDVPAATIYESSVQPTLDAFLAGYNGLVACYGQSQSGKSFTIASLTIHILNDIFCHVRATAATVEYMLRVSYVEVHDETLVDLLATEPASAVTLHQGATDRVWELRGHTDIPVTTADDALALVQAGNTKCRGEASCRHILLRLTLERRSKDGGSPLRVSTLDVVDLAASESVATTANPVDRSLLAFGHAMWLFSHTPTTAVPYQDSVLTQLVSPTLTLASAVALLCTVAPSVDCLFETHGTLKFASRVKRIWLRLELPVYHGTFQLSERRLKTQRACDADLECKVRTELAIRQLARTFLNRRLNDDDDAFEVQHA